MSSKVDFIHLNPELYRHPGERAARSKMDKIPGLNKALAALTDNAGLKAERQAQTASMTKIGPGVYPVLFNLWTEVQEQFGLTGIPLHVAWNYPQAYALRGGNDDPIVILDSKTLEQFAEREMTALLAMQAGSIRLGNATLLAAADFSRWFIDFYGIVGAPAMLPAWGLENWRRYALFSADRAAALYQGEPDAVCSALSRMAGANEKAWGGITNPDELRVQGLEALSLESDWSNSKFRRFALAMNRHNSVSLIRRIDLQDWFADGAAKRILSGETIEPETTTASNSDSSATHEKDPTLAYWGEFANSSSDKEPDADPNANPFTELREITEKGLGTFFKAGEAFWNTLKDGGKK